MRPACLGPSPAALTACSSPVTPEPAERRKSRLSLRLEPKPDFVVNVTQQQPLSEACAAALAGPLPSGSRAGTWPGRLHGRSLVLCCPCHLPSPHLQAPGCRQEGIPPWGGPRAEIPAPTLPAGRSLPCSQGGIKWTHWVGSSKLERPCGKWRDCSLRLGD